MHSHTIQASITHGCAPFMLPAIPWILMFVYFPALMASMLFEFEMVFDSGRAMLDWPVQYLQKEWDRD